MSISRMIDVVTSEVKQKLREYCKNMDDSELSPALMLKFVGCFTEISLSRR